jgi:hypothetical protein
MSRVLARTSMMSDDNMLNTATSTIIDSTTNIATRSTAKASNTIKLAKGSHKLVIKGGTVSKTVTITVP